MARRGIKMISAALRLDPGCILAQVQLQPSSIRAYWAQELKPSLPRSCQSRNLLLCCEWKWKVLGLSTHPSPSQQASGFPNTENKCLFLHIFWRLPVFMVQLTLYLKLHTGTLSVYLFVHLFSPELSSLTRGLFAQMTTTSPYLSTLL